jgi:hypothetical protein
MSIAHEGMDDMMEHGCRGGVCLGGAVSRLHTSYRCSYSTSSAQRMPGASCGPEASELEPRK